MRIQAVTVSGFRSFGPDPTQITLGGDLAALVGPNGSGKTALLQSLEKLFGVSRAQRAIQRTDFHIPADEDPANPQPRELFIDVEISLPELAARSATAETIAPAFRHMRVESTAQSPVCRMRLEARWEDDGTVEGDVVQEMYWVDTLAATPKDDEKHIVGAAERGLIQLYYTPASRNAAAQVRATAGALAARLLRAIDWSQGTKNAVEQASERLARAFNKEDAIAAISKVLERQWEGLHDETFDTKPTLSLVSRRFEEVVTSVRVLFQQGPAGLERGLEALSDGQQSLFYFALVAAVFDLERDAVKGDIEGFQAERLHAPALSIFALEEPENHLSPFYLARIVRLFRHLATKRGAQILISSHSPAVLSRVDPQEVRYFRTQPLTRVSVVRPIKLPNDDEQAAKFVRGAILAHPELYFARFVLLVEGDSERVVLPRLAEALDLLIDPAFVAIVPLGGRHVDHFWRLLNDLGIPYATLLDLDLGRAGGGFGRVKTVVQQLLRIGVNKRPLLELEDDSLLTEADLAEMHTWQKPENLKNLAAWISCLRKYNVFFSAPLDLDLMMLAAFHDVYAGLTPSRGGPRMNVAAAATVALGEAGPGLKVYEQEYRTFRKHLPAYRYHFLTRSKPATHIAALSVLSKATLRDGMPKTLKKVLRHIEKRLTGE